MMPLKSTRLDLHSLKGGSPNELPPPRRRGYQRTGNGIPPTQRQWRKRDHGSLKRKPPKPKRIPQSPSPEGYHSSTNPTSGCIVPPQDFHWSTFSFSESRTAFSFAAQKKKRFWPPPGRQKTNCKVKTPRSPTKEKVVFPARVTPHPRRHSTHRAPAVSKRHSRQETACRQRLGCGPGRAGHISTNEKRILFRRGRVRICGAFPPAPSRMPRPTILQMRLEILPTHFCPKPIVGRQNL